MPIKKKYVELATRKIISSYGGVGSLIETTKGSIIIDPFDKWPYCRNISTMINENDFDNLKPCLIDDQRLINRLRHQFKNLTYLIKVPDNSSISSYSSDPEDKTRVVKGRYFPEWFYCEKCHSFQHISAWWDDWNKALSNISKEEKEESFQEPKCAYCYLKQRNQLKKSKSKLHFNPNLRLEQVHFVMTAPNGEIADFPWDRWNMAKKDSNGKTLINFNEKCCDHQELQYIRYDSFDDYSGIRIRCKNCGKENNLSGIFVLKLKVFNTKDVFYKPVIRTSNSVYYPIIFNSLYIPIIQSKHSNVTRNLLIDSINNGRSIAEISDWFKISKEEIEEIINPTGNDITEEQYRLKEYQFITLSKEGKRNKDFISENCTIKGLSSYHINILTKIKKLKLTSVQTAYTRQEPYSKDDFLTEGDDVKAKFTSNYGNQTIFLPAVESYGEGIFIQLNQDTIEKWFKNHSVTICGRLNKIKKNIIDSQCKHVKKFENDFHFAKFMLIHTLSHILIKEFEFLCGYPATSLSERLYINGEKMSGLLLYTIAGAEGSYGGVVSQGSDERLSHLLHSALLRAKDCASDPVCYNSDGQGIHGKNLAACYNCALLPETSCEEFNSYLDRALLIDEGFGFFKDCI